MTPRYAPYYCEENIWFLLEDLQPAEGCAVFITNATHSVALWSQRASPRDDGLTLWDYHVVAVARVEDIWQVFDLDSTIGSPAPLATWVDASFPFAGVLPADVEPMFRVVPAAELFATFRTDRSHMSTDDGEPVAEPPPWPKISNDSNLAEYLDPSQTSPGEVLDLAGLLALFEDPE